MTVTVHLKDGRAFEYKEHAVLDDWDACRLVLSYGKIEGGRVGNSRYHYEDVDHICYSWNDVEKVEVTA